jgi:hypothetical protein
MALTICAYCDKSFLEMLPSCPHCKKPQMDVVEHAYKIVRVETKTVAEANQKRLAVVLETMPLLAL